ncbi:F-box/LRR-repeat protein At3g26922-like [Silene latifolia]|uniref:F-box/LRR-repeat protein At3g26922-like n=1 Tax=Silene latifolia TaxID=37657 RepID=UPI003D7811E6
MCTAIQQGSYLWLRIMELMPKNPEIDVDRDRLSELPDELIVHILSLMPTLEAVRTVLIGPRFGNLWKWVHTLWFGDADFLDQMFGDGLWMNDSIKCGRFVIFVRNVLMLHKRLSIDTFRLSIQFSNHKDNLNIVDEVKMWLRFALDRQAKQIMFFTRSDRQFMEDHLMLPNLTSDYLDTLGLSGCRIDTQVHVNLKSLNYLLLNQIIMTDEAFHRFVSGCPSLRKLCVLRPSVIQKLCFSDPKIDTLSLLLRNPDNPCLLYCPNHKNLELEIFNHLPEVIDVSSIRYINVKDFLYATNTDEQVSALKMLLGKFKAAEVFQLSFNASVAFLMAIENIELLQTKWNCIILEFFMFSEGCLLGLYQLIRSSGQLKELILRTRGSDTAAVVVQLPPCVLPKLTTITLHGDVKPCSSQLKLLEFLLKSAPVLDKVVIIPLNELNGKDRLEFAKQVSRFPMASTTATIVLK